MELELNEVIENLKYLVSGSCTDTQFDYIEEIEIATKALEKQIPRKTIITGHNNAINTDVGRCPICNGVELRACDHDYCPDCGQKLDWRDEE